MQSPCRDIKPENLLLFHPDGAPDGPEGLILKVVDYGCSTFCVPGKRLCKKFGTVSALWPLCPCGHTWPGLADAGRRVCLQAARRRIPSCLAEVLPHLLQYTDA